MTDETIRPTERRYAESLPSDGPNGQSLTRMRVARPTDPGAIPGVEPWRVPLGAQEVEAFGRAAPAIDVPDDRDPEPLVEPVEPHGI